MLPLYVRIIKKPTVNKKKSCFVTTFNLPPGGVYMLTLMNIYLQFITYLYFLYVYFF